MDERGLLDALGLRSPVIVDLFAGPGGWSEALKNLGKHDIGIEWDMAACRTRAAAGHRTIRADVSAYPTVPFVGQTVGLIASPPCQDFSVAGKQAGITGYRGRHIYEVLRWAEALEPNWIACEQVTPCLPVWEDFARIMQGWGYRTWTGILNSADYGVPQCRKRAILMASKNPFSAPIPTHTERPTDDIFGNDLKPWVTMAEGLGWGLTDRPAGTVVARSHEDGASTGGIRPLDGGSGARATYRKAQEEGRWKRGLNTGRDWPEGGTREDAQVVDPDRPAPTVTGQAVSWQWDGSEESSGAAPENSLESTRLKGGMWSNNNRLYDPSSEPAPTVAFGKDAAGWVWTRPATTVVGSFRPDIIAAPGYRVSEEDGSRQDAPGSVQVTLEEVAILQSFRRDYPWQGSKTKCFQQVGNACPPLLAEAILRQLV